MSVSHILKGNQQPLNVEFNNVVVNGTLTASVSAAPTIVTVPCVVGGPWATNINSFYRISYIGTPGVTALQVTVMFDPVGATATIPTFITISPSVPSQFRTNNGISTGVSCYDNGNFITGFCIGSTDISGNIYIQSPGAGNFSGTGQTGYDGWTFNYIVY